MKRTLITTALTVYCLIGMAQTQDIMVIEKNDNTTLRLSVDEIRRVVFESAYVNPQGTISEAVDLGLPSGVKWAKWNLGATKATEYGGYYGWADPTGLQISNNLSDYPSANPPSEISGTQFDIVHTQWGGQWRLPTYDDIVELYENSRFYKSGDVIQAVGPNGNSIFFPLAGSREDSKIYDDGDFGYYWSGTIHPDDNECAWLLTFDMKNGKIGIAGGSRYFGLSIRPVWGTPQAPNPTVTTGAATEITQNSAVVSGTIADVKTSTTVGILYGSTSQLSISKDKKKTTTSMGGYSVTLTDLTANTRYYYRAFAEVNGEYYYGETKSFTTEAAPEPVINVKTYNATDVAENHATLNGHIEASNTTKSYTVGFFLATSGTPSTNNYKSKLTGADDQTGKFYYLISGLSGGTTYYFRAYVLYDGKYYYGDTKSFTTEKAWSGTLNGHEWVDLGLPSGLKWATCNVGASSPSAYGGYYAWGETSTKTIYDDSHYSYGTNSTMPYDISGTIYDVAKSKWGSTWRMPTFAEIRELANNCTFVWTTLNGIYGAKLIGPNGHDIFLPAGGAIGKGYSSQANIVCRRGESGHYWSSSLLSRANWNQAKYMFFKQSGFSLTTTTISGSTVDMYLNGFNGFLIRPVTN